MYKYSASTGGFYVTEIHGDNIPSDSVEISDDQHSGLMNGQATGKIISSDANGFPILADPPAPSIDEIKTAYSVAIQNHLDTTVQSHGYDNMLACCSYVNSSVDAFKAEAAIAIKWRDDVWSEFFNIINSDTELPPIEIIISNLPTIQW
jgi:hypothetical protein